MVVLYYGPEDRQPCRDWWPPGHTHADYGISDPIDEQGAGSFVTLVVGVKATDGVVFVGDSRETMRLGSELFRISDQVTKIVGFDEGYVIGISGFGALAVDLLEQLRRADVFTHAVSVRDAVKGMGKALRKACGEEFGSPALWPPVAFLLGGLDNGTGAPSIFLAESASFFAASAPSAVPIRACVGSTTARACAHVIRKLLAPEEAPLSLDAAKAFGVLVVDAVAEFDSTVGGHVRIGVVTRDGYTDASAEAEGIRTGNAEMIARVRRALFAGR